MIHGPPHTGKTKLIVEAILQVSEYSRNAYILLRNILAEYRGALLVYILP